VASEQERRVLAWSDVVAAVFRDQDIKTGLWRLGVGLRFAGATTGPSDDSMLPSGIVAMESLALESVDKEGPLVFDAAKLQRRRPGAAASDTATFTSTQSATGRKSVQKPTAKKASRKTSGDR